MKRVRTPKGWKKVSLDELAHIQTGLSKSARRKFHEPIVVHYLRVANVQDGYIDLREVKTISVERKDLSRFLLREGDVLLTEGGDFDKLGRGCVWQGQIDPCIHQNHVFAVRPTDGIVLPEFIAAQAGSSYGRNYFLACSKQTTNLASINSAQLKQFPVLLPPVHEQLHIVTILSTWDRGIEQLERLIVAKERFKRGLMRQLLTGNRGFPDSGMVPEPAKVARGEWDFPRARDVFESITVKKLRSEPVLSVTQDQGVIRRDSIERKINANATNHGGYKLVEPGQFVISLRSFQGGLEYSALRGIVSPAYHVIRAKLEIDHEYYRYLFKSHWFIGHLAIAVIGIRDGKQISFDDFGFLRLPYPPITEQRRISATLKTCDVELDRLRKQLEAVKRQKNGLMQETLTGQLRVPAKAS